LRLRGRAVPSGTGQIPARDCVGSAGGVLRCGPGYATGGGVEASL
jgi:hypothetical protein